MDIENFNRTITKQANIHKCINNCKVLNGKTLPVKTACKRFILRSDGYPFIAAHVDIVFKVIVARKIAGHCHKFLGCTDTSKFTA